MTKIVEQLRLRGQAEEDVYFARQDRALIEALRQKRAGAAGMKIVSGGQTGVDRAALDVAAALGLASGGWCPRGRRAEDGVIPARYPLTETPSADSLERTEWNVRDADATLILCRGAMHGGTLTTAELAQARGRPLLVVDLGNPGSDDEVETWRIRHGVTVLNVAGPRESDAPGIYDEARGYLTRLLSRHAQGERRDPP